MVVRIGSGKYQVFPSKCKQPSLSDATYLGRALIPALKGRAKFKSTLRVEDIVQLTLETRLHQSLE